jgi:hypothetical protein
MVTIEACRGNRPFQPDPRILCQRRMPSYSYSSTYSFFEGTLRTAGGVGVGEKVGVGAAGEISGR